MSEPPEPGKVVGIWTAAATGAPMESHREVAAVAGRGLEGDRHFDQRGRGRQVTLVTQEAVDALAEQHGMVLAPGATRRNVVTRGVDLDELVGKRFRVGEVELEGVRPCHPCEGLEELNEVPGLRKALAGYGGLRADVVTGGTIRLGDEIVPSS